KEDTDRVKELATHMAAIGKEKQVSVHEESKITVAGEGTHVKALNTVLVDRTVGRLKVVPRLEDVSKKKDTVTDFGFLPGNCEHFQSRVKLDKLKTLAISSEQKIVKLAVTGISGSGKTELVKRFALDYRDSLLQLEQTEEKRSTVFQPFIAWLDARSEDTLF